MILPELPSKCIECIINQIEENDIKTLHSATLVNHDWCKFSIVRLWRAPLSFSNLITNSNPNLKNSNSNSTNLTTKYPFNKFYKIIPILLSFLDLNSKKDLNNLSKHFYIPKDTSNFYPRLHYDLKIPIQDLKIPTSSSSFDYPKYIKLVSFVDLVVLVNKWLNNLLSETLSNSSRFLNFYLYKSLSGWEYLRYMTNSINFHCPFINFDKNPQIFFNFIIESLFKILFNYSMIDSLYIMDVSIITNHLCKQLIQLDHNNNDQFLSNLSHFDFCQMIDSRILKKISKYNIISISLSISSEDSFDDVIDFINSLHSLQSVSIIGNNVIVTPIIQSLQIHTSTLIKLKLNSCIIDDDAIKSLSKFDNLQDLILHQLHFTIDNDDDDDDDDENDDDDINNNIIISLNFPKLKKLTYWEYSSKNSLITFIIKNNGHNLTHLDIHTSMERCIKLFDLISKNCSSLISLITPISEEKDFIALFSILKHCKFLKILYVYEFNIITINEDVILSFINFIPDSLLYLKINKLEFSQFKLGYQLKNCSIISEVLFGKNSLAVKEFFSSIGNQEIRRLRD
ncbi:unnamed protein product [Rhizophagus irregularis]|uniref:F-box domain-containing protein n=4 Tax=Rhizophagus irregularis TaxID=588596 RepID=A0A916EGS8_9GLOM|nr:unnamed protein product [Rhizophagus irregularis]CAB5386279.1 unnamed protein product [Rhizophagus irregularis]